MLAHRASSGREASPVRLVLRRLWWLIVYGDTTPTRFFIAVTATMWALLLIYPGDTFTRPVYRYMAVLMGDDAEIKWTLLWSLHATGMYWRIFSSTPRPYWALAIHTLGLVLFTTAAIGIFLTLTTPVPAAIAPDILMVFAAFWVLVRTHINSEPGWRND